MLFPAPLATTTAVLRSGMLDLDGYIDELCDRIDQSNPLLEALLPEENRRARLHSDAQVLQSCYPDSMNRPPLYGIPVGVKDTFRVDGFPTQAGSQLPPELFAGTEAECVTMLRAAGALILGKTVTTEFAYFEPGPTRNPLCPEHTPGGSSSGSVAAVAAGLCPLALGTQVIGSTIRPAAYCGIFGFKPTYGRIPTTGLIRCADTVEHVGYFTQDLAGIALVAPLLCSNWRTTVSPEKQPVLGVPDGPYLEQASAEALSAFEHQLVLLQQGGYSIKRVAALQDIEEINRRHTRMVFAEMAQVHATWFARHERLYRPRTAAAIREGQSVGNEELERARVGRLTLRAALEAQMAQAGIDIWVSPATTEPAPEGLHSTGSPIMNLPWTYTGMPAITLPAGFVGNGLPLGLQCVSATMTDEDLLQWVAPMADMLASQFKVAR